MPVVVIIVVDLGHNPVAILIVFLVDLDVRLVHVIVFHSSELRIASGQQKGYQKRQCRQERARKCVAGHGGLGWVGTVATMGHTKMLPLSRPQGGN